MKQKKKKEKMEIENGGNKFVSSVCEYRETNCDDNITDEKGNGTNDGISTKIAFFVILFRFRIGRERCGKIGGETTCVIQSRFKGHLRTNLKTAV